MKSFKEENQKDINRWFSEHPKICTHLHTNFLNVEEHAVGNTYRYRAQSLFLRHFFNQDAEEKIAHFTIDFRFEGRNLRQVLLIWNDRQNSAAIDISHVSDSNCCRWINGVLKTAYGKNTVWPYEMPIES